MEAQLKAHWEEKKTVNFLSQDITLFGYFYTVRFSQLMQLLSKN